LAENELRQKKKGYLKPSAVRKVAFWTTSACILVAVVSCLLAIWQFTETDVLWRTVATCAVIAAGMMAFYVINTLFDWPGD
jgi:membrane protein YdbS with pleckstrin-like domain